MTIGCGSCKGTHDTAAQVKECFGIKVLADKGDIGAQEALYDNFQAARATVRSDNAATAKQVAFLTTLVSERNYEALNGNLYERAFDIATGSGKFISKPEASALIQALMEAPKVAKASETGKVYADVPEGMHAIDGKFVKVYVTKHGNHQLVGKVLVIDGQDEDGKYRCHFEYGGKKALKGLTEATKLSADEAKQFGLVYGICVRCGLDLTKEESIHVGYGATCAGHEGWYYPTKAQFRALLEQAKEVV